MARGTGNRRPEAEGGRAPSPFMQQFFRAKEQYPDAIVLFRLGDFYELFHEDAVVVSASLGLTLTARGVAADGAPIPMAGVPHHAVSGYITRLLELGHKVAICEQMADPSTVRGIVPREVVRVITPGLCLDEDALDARTENLLVALTRDGTRFGVCAFELTTAELRATVLDGEASLLSELARLEPREILLTGETTSLETPLRALLPRGTCRRDARAAESFATLLDGLSEEVRAASAGLEELAARALLHALAYAKESQPGKPLVVERLVAYDPSDTLLLDEAAVRSLEILRTQRGETKGSLLHAIDETATSMGARLLRRQLLGPLTDVAAIRRRHDVVEALVDEPELRDAIKKALGTVPDLERLATRASLGVATPRDLGAMRDALDGTANLVEILTSRRGIADDPLACVAPDDVCADVAALLGKTLVERPPVTDKQGGIFRAGFDAELDEQRTLAEKGRDYVLVRAERRHFGARGKPPHPHHRPEHGR
jgi:DNA mismatch repair protein MutS